MSDLYTPDPSYTPTEASTPAVASYYMVISLPPGADLMEAGFAAAALAKRARTTVCVHAGAPGEAVRCFGHDDRARAGTAASAPPAAKRGADWSSKSGHAVTLMLRPEGASMGELSSITGWTFGQKYMDQLARSFCVMITTRPAEGRNPKLWFAVRADAAASVAEAAVDAGADDVAAMGELVELVELEHAA